MAFKNPAQRAAFFEKLKQKGGLGNNLPRVNKAPEATPLTKMAGIPKIAPLVSVKPIGSFERLKRGIKMPKVGY